MTDKEEELVATFQGTSLRVSRGPEGATNAGKTA
jgi:hypothetical protein